MQDREFGLKGLAGAGAGVASMVGGLGSVAAQDDDVEVSEPGADDPSVTSGDTTSSVVDGEAMVDVAEDDDDATDDDVADDDGSDDDVADDAGSDDDGSDEDGDDDEADDDEGSVNSTTLTISSDGGPSISDASGGDDNFAFVS